MDYGANDKINSKLHSLRLDQDIKYVSDNENCVKEVEEKENIKQEISENRVSENEQSLHTKIFDAHHECSNSDVSIIEGINEPRQFFLKHFQDCWTSVIKIEKTMEETPHTLDASIWTAIYREINFITTKIDVITMVVEKLELPELQEYKQLIGLTLGGMRPITEHCLDTLTQMLSQNKLNATIFKDMSDFLFMNKSKLHGFIESQGLF